MLYLKKKNFWEENGNFLAIFRRVWWVDRYCVNNMPQVKQTTWQEEKIFSNRWKYLDFSAAWGNPFDSFSFYLCNGSVGGVQSVSDHVSDSHVDLSVSEKLETFTGWLDDKASVDVDHWLLIFVFTIVYRRWLAFRDNAREGEPPYVNRPDKKQKKR